MSTSGHDKLTDLQRKLAVERQRRILAERKAAAWKQVLARLAQQIAAARTAD